MRQSWSNFNRESKIRKIQVEKFAQQVKNFETEMVRLERFEKKLRVITALENSPRSIEKNWGVGGPYGLSTNSFTTSMGRGAANMVERLSNGLGHLGRQAKIQSISFQELDDFFKNQKSLLSSTPSIWPTRGWVTSGFGFRKSPFTGLREKHGGWDIAARNGAPVRTTADGVVVVEGREYGYGNLVEIDHGYGHCYPLPDTTPNIWSKWGTRSSVDRSLRWLGIQGVAQGLISIMKCCSMACRSIPRTIF